jgi:CheY-like chemotaxis protein
MVSDNYEKLDILAVEDGIDNQILLRLFLRDYPCDVQMADNGEEAVRMFTRQSYDVVIMDIQMPIKDGFTAIREIREFEFKEQRKPSYIIALTAYEDEERVRKCEQAGSNYVMHKPISCSKLWKVLDTVRDAPVPLILLKAGMRELIPGYIHNRYIDMNQISDDLKNGDYENIGMIGHKMKGSGTGYGLAAVSRIGNILAKAAAAEQASVISDAVTELKSYLSQIQIIYVSPDHSE